MTNVKQAKSYCSIALWELKEINNTKRLPSASNLSHSEMMVLQASFHQGLNMGWWAPPCESKHPRDFSDIVMFSLSWLSWENGLSYCTSSQICQMIFPMKLVRLFYALRYMGGYCHLIILWALLLFCFVISCCLLRTIWDKKVSCPINLTHVIHMLIWLWA